MSIRLTQLVRACLYLAVAPVAGAAQVATDDVWAPPLPAVASGAMIVVDVSGIDSAVARFVAPAALRLRAERRLHQAGIRVGRERTGTGVRGAFRLRLHAGLRPPLEAGGDLGLVVSVALVAPDAPAVPWRTIDDFRQLTAYRFLRDVVPPLVDAHLDAFVRAYSRTRTRR
jgi:hypothetical protein